MKDRLREFKKIIQESTKHKSVTTTKDGKVEIICRFKPEELLINDQDKLDKITKSLCKKLENITGCNYRVAGMQKQPAFCYNTYARLLRDSSAASNFKFKKFLNYFKKADGGQFVKTSYAELTLIFLPQSKDLFLSFLSND